MIPIDEIYDAAFDRSRFQPVLRKLIEGLGGQSGFLGWTDLESRAGFAVDHGNDPAWLQQYVETYMPLDVMQPYLVAQPEGEPVTAFPFLQQPDIRESRFYREYLAPQGVVDNLAVNLIKRPGMMATLAILRREPAPPFTPAEVDALTALVPHLRRAVFLQAQVISQANLVRGFRQAAKSTRDGLMLLDDGLRVVDIDPDLAQLTGLAVGETLGRTGFGRAVAGAIQDDRPCLAEIERADDAPLRLLCHAQPVTRDPYGDLADGPGVAHAVHATMLDNPWPIALPLIAQLHGLTPTEMRVLEDALAHGDISAVGDRLGMARATARTHLHRIYDKTGTRGFADLCVFVHRFILPRPVATDVT